MILLRKFFAYIFVISIFVILSFSHAAAQSEPNLTPVSIFDELFRQSSNQNSYASLITDNNEAWYARWHILSKATKTIDITYFVIDNDIFGMSMLGMLLKKAKEGVRVRLMMDARGTKELTRKMHAMDYLQELLEVPGVEIKVYNPEKKQILNALVNIRNYMASNHDKMMIVDGEWLVTGGRNLSKSYLADPRDYKNAYHDTDVLIKGKSVASCMKAAFDSEFNAQCVYDVKKDIFNWKSRAAELECARRSMEDHINGLPPLADNAVDKSAAKFSDELSQYKNMRSYRNFDPISGLSSYPIIVLDKNSFKGKSDDITPALMALITRAQKEIMIHNYCINMTPRAFEALKTAGGKGVSINILSNSPVSSEHTLAKVIFLQDWDKLLTEIKNCRLFGYNEERQLHSKVFIFDRKITVIGSYNFDYVSEQINSEIVVAIKSEDFANKLAEKIIDDENKLSVEYKIKTDKDGKIISTDGPEKQVDPKKLKLLERLKILGFLRPIL